MSEGKGKTGILLPVVLIGAVLLSGIGLVGLFLQAADRDGEVNGPGMMMPGTENEQIATAEMAAGERYDESYRQVQEVRDLIPAERDMPISAGFDEPPVPAAAPGDGDLTRSDDDLLSQEGYIDRGDSPEAPEVGMDDTFSLLGDDDDVLDGTLELVRNGDVPDELPSVDVEKEVHIPITENGVRIDEDLAEDVSGDLGGLSEELQGVLGENAPDTNSAGFDTGKVPLTTWDVSNSTVRDEDGDGNPELKLEFRVASGTVNRTMPNGTLAYIVGCEYEYRDSDSDGYPEFERSVNVRFANFTMNGLKVAEGLSYSEVLRNDTDGDGVVDRVEMRHLSFGYHATVLGTVRSFALGGELIMDDVDEDGVFEKKEGTAFLFFRHQIGSSGVIIRESLVLVQGKEAPNERALSKLAFTRLNNTRGETLLERGYLWSYHEGSASRDLLVIAGRNDTVTGRLQYVILNATEESSMEGSRCRVTAFGVNNSTLPSGKERSDAVAVDYDVRISGSRKEENGFLAAARTEKGNGSLEESFILISVNRTGVSSIPEKEDSTVLIGRNVTNGGLNSTVAFASRMYRDADRDGNPEYLRESWAVGRSEDHDRDGVKELEGYIVHWNELRDLDDDTNPEWNQTFTMMGWKRDTNDDSNIDVERGVMVNRTAYDENSNGTVELMETGIIGFEKTDTDSDGTIDSESYIGFWEKVTDVHDDGTEINRESGTWSHRS